MEHFWSDGGNNRPFFLYRLKLKHISTDMFNWCDNYPGKGPFSRWHVIYNYDNKPNIPGADKEQIPVIQFELRDAYLAFQYAFAGEIIEDLTWVEYR
jgi:hypothetical protein